MHCQCGTELNRISVNDYICLVCGNRYRTGLNGIVEGKFEMGTYYEIISKPDYITFECPHCEEEVQVPFECANYNTSYWGDGALVNCPECGKEVELDEYDYS